MAQLVAEVYAHALFDAASESNILESVYTDYKEVVETLGAHPALFELVKSPKIEKEEKKSILDKVFAQAIQPELLNLFKILIDKRRTNEMIAIFNAYEEKYREHFKLQRAVVRTVTPLTAKQMEVLGAKLGATTGLTIDIVNVVDPTVLGGMLIQIGDQVMDGSLKRKLGGLKESLTQLAI